jgi:hypothetical protein
VAYNTTEPLTTIFQYNAAEELFSTTEVVQRLFGAIPFSGFGSTIGGFSGAKGRNEVWTTCDFEPSARRRARTRQLIVSKRDFKRRASA